MKTRKELKDEYKRMKFQIGIFQIRNILNNKIYIGSSPDLKSVWNREKFQLEMGMHYNTELQKEWKQFGAENFVYEIIEEIKQNDEEERNYKSELKDLEKTTIERLQPYGEKGYHKPIVHTL